MAARITGMRYKTDTFLAAQAPPHYRPLQAGGFRWRYAGELSGGGGAISSV